MAFDPLSLTFYCERREMPVMKDTTDCWGCPMKTYPSACLQYKHWHAVVKRGELGYDPDPLIEPASVVLTEPARPLVTE